MTISHQAIREFERAFNAGELSIGLVLQHRFVRDENYTVTGHRIVAKMDIIARTPGGDPAMVISWKNELARPQLNPVAIDAAEAP